MQEEATTTKHLKKKYRNKKLETETWRGPERGVAHHTSIIFLLLLLLLPAGNLEVQSSRTGKGGGDGGGREKNITLNVNQTHTCTVGKSTVRTSVHVVLTVKSVCVCVAFTVCSCLIVCCDPG